MKAILENKLKEVKKALYLAYDKGDYTAIDILEDLKYQLQDEINDLK